MDIETADWFEFHSDNFSIYNTEIQCYFISPGSNEEFDLCIETEDINISSVEVSSFGCAIIKYFQGQHIVVSISGMFDNKSIGIGFALSTEKLTRTG